MVKRSLVMSVTFFLLLMLAHQFFDPAYTGYLIAYGALLLAFLLFRVRVKTGWRNVSPGLMLAIMVWACLTLVTTLFMQPTFWDVLRDLGMFLSFFIGRYMLPSWRQKFPLHNLLRALSVVGVFVSVATLIGAFAAYEAGASEYIWRGVYVPYTASWLPYFLVVDVALMRLDPLRVKRYAALTVLCIASTLASLARTSFVLESVFLIAMLYQHRRALLFNPRGMLFLLVIVLAGASALPRFMQLNVVQNRISATKSTDDASLSWRYTENNALYTYMNVGDGSNIPLGYGLGARVPLPVGVTDFTGHRSIPFLHNSFLTIVLKFGLVGLLIFAMFVWKKMLGWYRLSRSPSRILAFAGGWIVLFVFGAAVTLQGLTEWSHLIFFGIGCALLSPGEESDSCSRASA